MNLKSRIDALEAKMQKRAPDLIEITILGGFEISDPESFATSENDRVFIERAADESVEDFRRRAKTTAQAAGSRSLI